MRLKQEKEAVFTDTLLLLMFLKFDLFYMLNYLKCYWGQQGWFLDRKTLDKKRLGLDRDKIMGAAVVRK